MAIADTDLEFRLSGGASNTNPDSALGGAMSTVAGGEITSDADNNDMDDITAAEAIAGITIYRGFFLRNNHGSIVYEGPVIWIESQTSLADTSVEIAIADEDVSVDIETIADEETAPVGPTFSAPANEAAGLAIGAIGDSDLAAGEYRGFWIKYTVNALAGAGEDQYTLKVNGESAP